MMTAVEMTGRRFGILTVIARAAHPSPHAHWICRCDCENEIVACGKALRKGQYSCGCVNLGKRTHGQTNTGTYQSWIDMRRRCNDPENAGYVNYGARGISVCARWQSFENFLADMGHRPSGYSIERIDNDGNYEPSNCCWLPLEKQSRNRRSVRRVLCDGPALPFSEAASKSGLNKTTVHYRIKAGWPEERLLEPVR